MRWPVIGERCLAAGNERITWPSPSIQRPLWATLTRWIALPAVAPENLAGDFRRSRGRWRRSMAWDVAAGLHNALGREGLYLSQLDKFARGEKDFNERLTEALRTEDWKTATRFAHTLKGVAAQIGAHALAACAAELEQAPAQAGWAIGLVAAAGSRGHPVGGACRCDRHGAADAGRRLCPLGGAAEPGAVAEVFGRLASLLAADDFSSGQVARGAPGVIAGSHGAYASRLLHAPCWISTAAMRLSCCRPALPSRTSRCRRWSCAGARSEACQ